MVPNDNKNYRFLIELLWHFDQKLPSQAKFPIEKMYGRFWRGGNFVILTLIYLSENMNLFCKIFNLERKSLEFYNI